MLRAALDELERARARGRTREASLTERVPPRVRLPRLLWDDVVFPRYWSAHTISLFGDQISLLAIPLVAVLALDASAA